MLKPLSSPGSIGFGLPTARVAAAASGPATGMAAWWEANSGVLDGSGNPCTDGVAVATWQDQSGNGWNAIQATSGNRPILKTAILNSLPVVRFVGATPQFLLHSYSRGAGDSTIFAVAKRSVTTSGIYQDIIQCAAVNTPLSVAISAQTDSSTNWGAYYNATIDSSYSCGSQFLIMCVNQSGSGVTLVFRSNTNSENKTGSGFYTDSATDRRFIGSAPPPWSSFSGDIAELLIYERVLSAGDQASTYAYLAAKYGL